MQWRELTGEQSQSFVPMEAQEEDGSFLGNVLFGNVDDDGRLEPDNFDETMRDTMVQSSGVGGQIIDHHRISVSDSST